MRKKLMIIIVFFGCFLIVWLLYDNYELSTKVVSYNGSNLMISVDGVSVSTLPTSGDYYLASYDCKNSNTVVTWDKSTYQLTVSNGNKKGGVSCYLNFETYPKLSDVAVGSYVSYTGNNGCTGMACSGQNVNYVSDSEKGFCYDYDAQFYSNGWRIAYIKNGSVYLVSAGAPECMCTTAAGSSSSSSCDNYETTGGLPKHLANLDAKALNYCNTDYAYNGICNSNSAWSIDATDFKAITGSVLSSSSCFNKFSTVSCGYNNDLIDNGGYYWYATSYSSSSNYMFNWDFTLRLVDYSYSSFFYGVRPVLRLESSVVVTGGSGTYEDPYTIGNNTFWINNGATTVSNANKGSVNLTLLSVNANKMCISTNTSVCTDYVDFATSYTLDWSSEEAGEKVVYVYYLDNTGRIVATIKRSITLSAS